MEQFKLLKETAFFSDKVVLKFQHGTEIELENIDGVIRVYAINVLSNQPNVEAGGEVDFKKKHDILFAEIGNIPADVKEKLKKVTKTENARITIERTIFPMVKITLL